MCRLLAAGVTAAQIQVLRRWQMVTMPSCFRCLTERLTASFHGEHAPGTARAWALCAGCLRRRNCWHTKGLLSVCARLNPRPRSIPHASSVATRPRRRAPLGATHPLSPSGHCRRSAPHCRRSAPRLTSLLRVRRAVMTGQYPPVPGSARSAALCVSRLFRHPRLGGALLRGHTLSTQVPQPWMAEANCHLRGSHLRWTFAHTPRLVLEPSLPPC